jgi:hypothetical protein
MCWLLTISPYEIRAWPCFQTDGVFSLSVNILRWSVRWSHEGLSGNSTFHVKFVWWYWCFMCFFSLAVWTPLSLSLSFSLARTYTEYTNCLGILEYLIHMSSYVAISQLYFRFCLVFSPTHCVGQTSWIPWNSQNACLNLPMTVPIAPTFRDLWTQYSKPM